jgi:hypothetical protein
LLSMPMKTRIIGPTALNFTISFPLSALPA